MNTKYLISLFLFMSMYQIGVSQTEKLITGKVIIEDFSNHGIDIDVINLTSVKNTVTNKGNFSILAKAGDTLIFIAKNYYYEKLFLKQKDIDKNNFIVKLTKKPIDLDELILTKMHAILSDAEYKEVINPNKLDSIKTYEKQPIVYDGSIVHGMDVMKLGEAFINLFKKKKETAGNHNQKIILEEYVTSNFNQSFFVKNLSLKPEEIDLFLEFCNTDPKLDAILESDENANILEIIDFLITKSAEFKKLPKADNE